MDTPTHARMRAFAVQVVKKLRQAGRQALFAGGCVRDEHLGRQPKDYDVATSARPDEVKRVFPRCLEVGAAFGVVAVVGPRLEKDQPPLQIEVATFRTESDYSDGRRPDTVAFASAEEDVRRRDFTINGLLYDPLEGKLLDFVGGLEDLRAGVIRAIGAPEERFAEDRLRMLRAIRFAARFGFRIDPPTFTAIRNNAEHIGVVSRERIRAELETILTGPRPRQAFEQLKSSGLLKEILPEVDALEGVAQPPEFHPEGDVWTHTLLLLEHLDALPESERSLTLALGALLHDIGKPRTYEVEDRIRFPAHESVGAGMTENLLRRLRFTNEVIDRVTALVKDHMKFMTASDMRKSTLKRFLREPHFPELLALHRLDCLASDGDLAYYDFCLRKQEEFAREPLRPAPLLNGRDLLALGLEPSPRFGKILNEVETAQLEGDLTTRAEAEAFVRARYLEPGSPTGST